MLSESFVKRLNSQKYIDAEALLKALKEPSPVSIRINSEKRRKKPLYNQQVPWCESGYYLGSRPSYTLDPLFHAGCYYPQEASGMFLEQAVRQLINPGTSIKVLDLCGAPGGKSTHLSSLIGQNSMLVANEVIRSRAGILVENVTKWGSSNTFVTQNDPSAFSRLHGFFDMIFVDAPCSGEGMFRDQVAVSEWSEENAAHCSERQKRILMDVWPALKTDGLLIYSTCTFNPGENEENIKWLLTKQEAESVNLDVSGFQEITEVDYQGVAGYGFYPDKVKGEGFFISVIRKTAKQDAIMLKRKSSPDLKLSRDEQAIAEKWINFQSARLIKNGNDIVLIAGSPDDYFFLSRNLNLLKAGIKICTIKNKDYLPSHEFALSDIIRKDAFPHINLNLRQALLYLRRDHISLPDAPKGWLLVAYNEVNLGLINNIGTRVNNYYPVEWRIRMNLPETGKENVIEWNQ